MPCEHHNAGVPLFMMQPKRAAFWRHVIKTPLLKIYVPPRISVAADCQELNPIIGYCVLQLGRRLLVMHQTKMSPYRVQNTFCGPHDFIGRS